jgi:hypothetical protein
VLYYCIPKSSKDIVAKARIATEEIYKLKRQQKAIAVNTADK